MDLDFSSLENLRRNHPAWRLLNADYAPLVMAFFDKVFVKPNVRGIEQAQLASLLEDELYELRQSRGAETFPKTAADYLDDWTQDARGWLRKYYPEGSDEAHFDLTPAAEKAIAWVESLTARTFVGSESRLRTVFELLRQLVEGSGLDPAAKIRDLKRQKKEIDRQIARIQDGELDLLDETALRERFQHMAATAREILDGLPRSGTEFPRPRPRHAREDRLRGGWQGRAVAGYPGAARCHRRFGPGTQLQVVLGLPHVPGEAGVPERDAGRGLRPARRARSGARREAQARPLRLDGSGRAHPAHRRPALFAN